MVYLYGSEVDKVHDIFFSVAIVAVQQAGITYGIVFTSGAAIKDVTKGSITYSANLWSMTLSSTQQYLSLNERLYPALYGDAPGVYGVGIKGDFVIARYQLFYCVSGYGYLFTYCSFLNVYADLFLVRPYVKDNRIEGWVRVDTTIDDNGLSGAFLWVKRNYRLSENIIRNDHVSITSWDLVARTQSTIRFSLGMPLMAIAKILGIIIDVPYEVLLGAMIGFSEGITGVSIITTSVSLKVNYIYSNYYLLTNYLIHPHQFLLGTRYYNVPIMYLDVYTYKA